TAACSPPFDHLVGRDEYRRRRVNVERAMTVRNIAAASEVFLYDVSEMALVSQIPYDWQTPNHLILKAPDARQSEEDRTTAGRTQGGCPIRSRIDASINRTPPSKKHRHVERDTSNGLGRLLCWR